MRVRRKKRNRLHSGDVVHGRAANFNRRKTRMKLGDHLVQCDVTGQVCFRSEASLTWRGLLVSNQNWDRRHPQLDIRVEGENIAVKDARPFKGSFQTVSSDILDTGTAQFTDKNFNAVANLGSFQFTNNGQYADFSGFASGEWWSNEPTDEIGNFFQLRVSVNQTSGDIAGITGDIGAWVSLASFRGYTVNFNATGQVIFYAELRDTQDLNIEASGFITVDNP